MNLELGMEVTTMVGLLWPSSLTQEAEAHIIALISESLETTNSIASSYMYVECNLSIMVTV